MATPIDNRPRPSLAPISTHTFADGLPCWSARNNVFSPSPRSPKTLPPPNFQSSFHDGSSRQHHDSSMVDRLDPRINARQSNRDPTPPGSASTSGALSPINEAQASNTRRYSAAPSAAPSLPSARSLLSTPTTPASPATAFPRRQTLVAETRSMLMAGVPGATERRQSAPHFHLSSEEKKAEQVRMMEELRTWGHVYLGNAKTADVFVKGVALRRSSDASTSSEQSCSEEMQSAKRTKKALEASLTKIRCLVRPKDIKNRKHFLLVREFNYDELRATIPDPLPRSLYSTAASSPQCSPVVGSSSPTFSNLGGSRFGHARRRSSSARQDFIPGLGRRGSRSSVEEVPIHLKYAKAHVPVLAALIVSGFIREGDIIELPMPHPEAWPETVEYIYTGQGCLTHAIRENINHLAGKA